MDNTSTIFLKAREALNSHSKSGNQPAQDTSSEDKIEQNYDPSKDVGEVTKINMTGNVEADEELERLLQRAKFLEEQEKFMQEERNRLKRFSKN